MQKDSIEEVRAACRASTWESDGKSYVPVMITTLEDPQNLEHKTVRKEIVMSLGVFAMPPPVPRFRRPCAIATPE